MFNYLQAKPVLICDSNNEGTAGTRAKMAFEKDK